MCAHTLMHMIVRVGVCSACVCMTVCVKYLNYDHKHSNIISLK